MYDERMILNCYVTSMTVGLGEYRLKPEFCHLKRDVQAMEMVQALNVDELLQQMQEAATMHHAVREGYTNSIM